MQNYPDYFLETVIRYHGLIYILTQAEKQIASFDNSSQHVL